MPTYTADQLKVIRNIRRIGRKRGEERVKIKSAFETGRVESNFLNLKGGDADSAGWRQERASIYDNPRALRHSINRYFNEADKLYHGQSAGELAADVQRPAAQFRGRYAEHSAEASRLLHGVGLPKGVQGAGGGKYSLTARGGAIKSGQAPKLIPGGEHVDNRAAMLAALLDKRKGMGLLDRYQSAVGSGDYTTTTPTKVDPGTGDQFIQGQKITVNGRLPDGAPPSSSKVEGALGWAKTKIGQTETGGANRSPFIDRIEKRFGMTGQAWCGMFLGTALQKAGVKGIDSRIASVSAIEQMAKSGSGGMKRWLSPADARRGDLLVTGAGQHVVMVTGRTGDTIHTIGGNSSDSVRRVDYSVGSVYGVARPRYHK